MNKAHQYNNLQNPQSQSLSGPSFDLQLEDATHVRFRPVKPVDRDRFSKGFQELSDETRYCRCFAFRKSLTDDELDMLCNVDSTSHVAMVAVSLDESGAECDSIGGARFILPETGSATAELAFLVTDAWQGRQVGQLLLSSLIKIAQARDVECMRCYLLPENIKARRLLMRVSQTTGWALRFDEEGGLLYSQGQHSSCVLGYAA